MRISVTISAEYPTITMIIAMTIQYVMTTLFDNHPGKQSASGHGKIPSCQHLENGLLPLN